MLSYILQRVAWAIPTLIGISMLSFVLMQLPPGDFLTSYAATLASQGEGHRCRAARQNCKMRTGWISRSMSSIGSGSPASSFGATSACRWSGSSVTDLIWDRMGWTVFVAFITIFVGYLIAIPIGVYSATHQYSMLDHLINAWGFLGLGIPNFTMALVVMWVAFAYFGLDLSGLFSDQFKNAPWSLGKCWTWSNTSGSGPDPRLERGSRPAAHDAREPARRAAQAVRHLGAGRRPQRVDG